MTPEQTKLIQDLADKLGTTAEHLWAVLVRQAPIAATTELVILAVSLLMLPILTYGCIKLAVYADDEDSYAAMTGSTVCGAIAAIALICIIGGVLCMDTTIAGFVNPEYWAFKQIVK